MRISKTLAVSAAGLSMAAAVALPAAAGTAHHPASKGTFKSTVSPNPVHTGDKLVLKASGAKKGKSYTCVVLVIKGKNYGIGSLLGSKTANRKGKFKCIDASFKPFSATVAGTVRHCPTTKADRKAGYKCGFAASTIDKTSNTISYFTAKK